MNNTTRLAMLMILLVLPIKTYAQLTIKIDTVEIYTIGDFPQEWSDVDVIDEAFETALLEGPHIYIEGQLVNSSQDAVIYDASYEGGALIEPVVRTSFRYKGRHYETEQRVSIMSDMLWALYEPSAPNLSTLYETEVGNEKVWIYYIPGNTSIPISFGSAFLYYSKWCKFKHRQTMYEIDDKDLKNNKKLEKIAREVLPTLQAHVEIVNKKDVWTKILIDGSNECH